MWEKFGRKKPKETIDKIKSRIYNHLEVVKSPLKNDRINIKYHITSGVIKTQKILIQIPIRKWHNGLIQHPSEGGFAGKILESGDVIIGDKSLKIYMPTQVKILIILIIWHVVVKYLYLDLWCSLN